MRLWLACAAVWLALAGLAAFVMPPAWEDTDDARMAMIAAGIGGVDGPSERLVYMSQFLGLTLRVLFMTVPGLPWYGLMLLSFHVVAHSGLTTIWIRITKQRRLLRIALLSVQLALAAYLWTHLQFTTTAALLTVSGLSLLVHMMEQPAASLERSTVLASRCVRGAAGFLLVLGSLVRFQSFLLCLGMLLPIIAVRYRGCSDPVMRRISLRAMVAAGLASVALLALDIARDQADPVWREFRSRQWAAARIINNTHLRARFLPESQLSALTPAQQDAIRQVGWSRNDLHSLLLWVYSNPVVYSEQNLNSVAGPLTSGMIQGSHDVLQTGLRALTLIVHDDVFVLLSGACLALLAGLPDRRMLLSGSLLLVLAIATLWGVLLMMKLPPRVFNAVALSVLAGCSLLTAPRDAQDDSPGPGLSPLRLRLSHVLLILLLPASVWVIQQQARHAWQFAEDRESVTEDIRTKILDGISVDVVTVPFPFDRLSPLDDLAWMDAWRFVYLDGHQQSPRAVRNLGASGVNPIVEGLIYRRRIRVIATRRETVDAIQQFLREHYNREALIAEQDGGRWVTIYYFNAFGD